MINKNCIYCGKEFQSKNNRGSPRFCSSKCRFSNWIENNPDDWAKMQSRWRKKLKMKAYINYGGNPPKCACCGENIIEFLCLDHIDNNGSEYRKEISGRDIYEWIATNDYPSGFQILCRNCNWGKYVNKGTCPHKSRLLKMSNKR